MTGAGVTEAGVMEAETMEAGSALAAGNAARHPIIDLNADQDAPLERARIEELCRAGHLSSRIVGRPLDLMDSSDGARHLLGWIACLRDLTACAVPVDWHATAALAPLTALFHHIAPPADDRPEFAEWRDIHRYGLCYWRSGPQFATIVDRRILQESHEFTLDTPDYLTVFTAAQVPVERARLEAMGAEALDALEAERLILSIAGWSLALPFRMRHWPVPFTAI